LNYAAVKKIGWTPTEAIGKQVDVSGGQLNGRVVGVIKDYNFLSLRSKVEPLFLIMRDHSWRGLSLAVKISPKDFPGTLGFIERTWKKMYPDNPFEYNFLDKSLDALYKSEKRSSVLFSWFSILSIAIACFGLYGLALYTAERRAKEVGIRRVLGASATEITFILSKEFAMWVVIANVIAWPVGYYIMNNWLEEFAYRINITPWIFLISGVLALVVAALTVGFHAIRAAIANPVESLRYE
jgi:putative ABC transport system permease protein